MIRLLTTSHVLVLYFSSLTYSWKALDKIEFALKSIRATRLYNHEKVKLKRSEIECH